MTSFYEELERVFEKFPKYCTKILFGDSAKVRREDIFKPTIRNKILRKISNDNGVRAESSATSKNLTVKCTMFLQGNIHKHTWIFQDRKTLNQIDHILIYTQRHSSAYDVSSFMAADCDTGHYRVMVKVMKTLAVNKQRSKGFHMERFNLKKFNEVQTKEKHCDEVSNRFAGLEDFDTEVQN
jgi:hypothetical protein